MSNKNERPRLKVVLTLGLCLLGIFTAAFLLSNLSSPHPTAKASAPEAVAETTPPQAPAAAPPPAPTGRLPQEWGIEVVGLYPSVGGRVLDLRYKIIDTAKAAELPNETGRIYLIDEATGATVQLPNRPKTGSIPQNSQKLEPGRSYSMSFPNPGGRFKSGSKLTVMIGHFRAEHLAVQ